MSSIHRRQFVQLSAAVAASSAWNLASAQERSFNPQPGQWRTFEFVTRVEVANPKGVTRVWLPVPSIESDYQQSAGDTWQGNARSASVVTESKYGAKILVAEFAADEARPVIELTSRFRTQNRATDFARKVNASETAASLKMWTEATDLMPTDGIVRKTALDATRGARTDIEKTQKIYDWVIANTFREPKVRGCGTGDIKTMLETGNMGGKCGDINALFVGLCRAAGIPARDVYGIRLVPSAFGYKELSGNPANLARAQHCRAEVHLASLGWVPMDPADVTKVMRLETPEWIKTTSHPVVAPVNKGLFGGWEGNWLGFNVAHDLKLPGAKGGPIGFFMYPNGENAEGMFDSLEPDQFKYAITAREVKA